MKIIEYQKVIELSGKTKLPKTKNPHNQWL